MRESAFFVRKTTIRFESTCTYMCNIIENIHVDNSFVADRSLSGNHKVVGVLSLQGEPPN